MYNGNKIEMRKELVLEKERLFKSRMNKSKNVIEYWINCSSMCFENRRIKMVIL